MVARWPGVIPAGRRTSALVQLQDLAHTFTAVAGAAPLPYADGYNLLPYLTGEEKEGPRKLFVYFSDDGDVLGIRYDNWKLVFIEQRCHGTLQVWAEPFTPLRLPKIYNLRTDPYEFADVTSNTYYDWILHHAYMIYAAQTIAAKFVETFKEFPAVQKPGTFTLDDALAKLTDAAGSAGH